MPCRTVQAHERRNSGRDPFDVVHITTRRLREKLAWRIVLPHAGAEGPNGTMSESSRRLGIFTRRQMVAGRPAATSTSLGCRTVAAGCDACCQINYSTDICPVCFSLNSAGELNSDELERIVTILQNPAEFKIPAWFLNRQKDIVDGKNSQVLSNGLDSKLRDDLERLKKIRAHRGLRHYWTREFCVAVSERTVQALTTCYFPIQSVSVVNTPRPLVAAVRPSVSPRRSKRVVPLRASSSLFGLFVGAGGRVSRRRGAGRELGQKQHVSTSAFIGAVPPKHRLTYAPSLASDGLCFASSIPPVQYSSLQSRLSPCLIVPTCV